MIAKYEIFPTYIFFGDKRPALHPSSLNRRQKGETDPGLKRRSHSLHTGSKQKGIALHIKDCVNFFPSTWSVGTHTWFAVRQRQAAASESGCCPACSWAQTDSRQQSLLLLRTAHVPHKALQGPPQPRAGLRQHRLTHRVCVNSQTERGSRWGWKWLSAFFTVAGLCVGVHFSLRASTGKYLLQRHHKACCFQGKDKGSSSITGSAKI